MNNLNKLFPFLNILQIYNSFLIKKEKLSDCENYFFCRKKAEIFNLFPKKNVSLQAKNFSHGHNNIRI